MPELKFLTRLINLIKIYPVIILVLIGFFTFANSFQNQFVWDDPAFFADNILVKNFDIPKIFTSNTVAGAAITSDYYRPFTSLSFAIDYKFWQLNPFGYHLTNTIFHILTALLIFNLLKVIKFNKTLAFWISLIFLVHPVQVEAVTYLSSRGDILYSFLFLLSLNLFSLSLYQKKPKLKLFKKVIYIPISLILICSILLYGLSIFAKEVSLAVWPMFIFILLLFKKQSNLSFQNLHQNFRGHFIVILMLFWASLMYMFLRVYFLNFNNSLNFMGSQDIYTTNILVRLLTFLKIIWLYLGLIFWPYPLYLERSTQIVTNFLNPYVISALILILILISLAIYEAKKAKTWWIFLGFFWIVFNIIPVSGIVPMTYLYHDNWLYMPIVGLLIILIRLPSLIFINFNFRKYYKVLTFSSSILVLVLIFLTIKQNTTWENPIVLFEHNLKYNKTARLHLNLGNAYMNLHKFEEAIYHLNEASKIADSYPQIHFNLAHIYIAQNKKDKARQELLKTFQTDPDYLYAYPFLINSYIETKEYDKALPFIDRLNKVYPEDVTLTILYGKLLYISNQVEQAETQFKKALQLSNNDIKILDKIKSIKTGEELF